MIRCTDRLLENFMKNKIIVIVFGKLKSYYKRRIKNKGWRRFLIFSSIIHAIIRIFLLFLTFLETSLKRVSILLINNVSVVEWIYLYSSTDNFLGRKFYQKKKKIVIVLKLKSANYKWRIKDKGWRRFLIFSSIIHAIIRIFLFESLIFLENGLKRVSISLINNIILLNENKIVVIVFGKLISTNYNRWITNKG